MAEITTIMPTIFGVPSWEAKNAWPLVEPLLAPSIALTKGAYEPEDVLKEIEAQDAQLWVAYTDNAVLGAVVSKIVIYPRKRVLFCTFVGGIEGRLADWWGAMYERLKEAKTAKQCDRIEGIGRRGWARQLPDMKYAGDYLMAEI